MGGKPSNPLSGKFTAHKNFAVIKKALLSTQIHAELFLHPFVHVEEREMPCGPDARNASGCATKMACTTSSSPSIAAAKISIRAPFSSK